MADGSVEFEIKADNSDVSVKINDTTAKLKAAAGTWESSTTQAANASSLFGNVLQGVGMNLGNMITNAAKNAGKAVLDFAKDCIGAASDLAEVKNVVDTVFGDSANEIYSWAEKAQSAFGLAQTQALKYASTLGAMLKSSGLGMDEVKEMSTALSGLAADMASFYNMDFDTAFEKLRSGISGETEPLKQLGINLSVANLEAYALAQGINKAYSEMSQAEQTALRFNYIMQATADAQGDFARTSDGYANSIRRLETAWETIKTSVGNLLITAITPAVDGIADLLEKITTKPESTIFDDLAAIEVDFEAEKVEIEETHEKAKALIDILEEIHNDTAVTNQQTQVTDLISALTKSIPGLYDALDGKDPSEKIEALANALSNNGQGISAETWTTALSKYGEFAEALDAAMKSADPTASIKALADELSRGSDIDASTWEDILNTFANALVTYNPSGTINDIEGKINALSEALAPKTNLPTSVWETALSYFESYGQRFFEAINSNDPESKLKDLAKALSAEIPSLDVKQWETVLNELSGYLTAGDANLNTQGIIDKLVGLTGAVTDASKVSLGDIISKINEDTSTPTTNVGAWTAVLGTFTENISGFKDSLNQYPEGVTAKVSNLANALSGIDGDEAKINAWRTLIALLADNAEGLASAMGWTEGQTQSWLGDLTAAVNSIDITKAGEFEKLLAMFLGGNGATGIGGMQASEGAAASFNALTSAMDSTYYASAAELEILKQLIAIFPQLSSIINTNTGEVKGGADAIKRYVSESEAALFQLAAQNYIASKLAVIEERRKDVTNWEISIRLNDDEMSKTAAKVDAYKKELERRGVKISSERDEDGNYNILNGSEVDLKAGVEGFEGIETVNDLVNAYYAGQDAVEEFSGTHDELADKIATTTGILDEERQKVLDEAEALGVSTGATEEKAGANTLLVESEEEAAKAVADLKQQLQDIVDYQENARKSALSTISQVVSGLKELDRTSEEYKGITNAPALNKNLEDQLAFLREYSQLMDKAQSRGVSDEVLASVADGSVESMRYLRGLANATEGEIKQINDKYEEVTKKKNDLADKVAATQLKVDESYQKMIDKAVEAAAAMDQSATAGAGATATVQAVIDAVAAAYPSLEGQVSAFNALLAQIGQVGAYSVGGLGVIGTGGGNAVGHRGGFQTGGSYAAPFAMGLDYVPYDGFLAELHQGETILTADEAAIWRNFAGIESANNQQAFDYDMIGAAVSGAIPSGGNVYLDGRTVGKVISQGQGDSYRRLQRSGWRG